MGQTVLPTSEFKKTLLQVTQEPYLFAFTEASMPTHITLSDCVFLYLTSLNYNQGNNCKQI